MATTSTFTTLLDQLLDDIPGLGWSFTTASIAAGSVTTNDQEIMRLSTNAPSDRFQGLFLYIPSAATADEIRSVTTTSVAAPAASNVATLTHAGPNTATGTTATAYLLAIHPDILRRLSQDALEREWTDYLVPLSHREFDDYDVQANNVTSWSDTVDATPTKVTDDTHVYEGLRALRVLNNGANGYSESVSMLVSANRTYLAWGIGRSAVGTVGITVRGSADISSVTTTESRFQYLWTTGDTGSNESVTLRVGGSGASDDGYWGGFGFQLIDDTVIHLPSWANQRKKVRGLYRAHFSCESASGVHDAFSRDLIPLKEGIDWEFKVNAASVWSGRIEVERRWLSYPLWIAGSRPHSDFETISTDASTTSLDFHTWLARFKQLLGEKYRAQWPDLEASASKKLSELTALNWVAPQRQAKVRRMY